MELDALIAALAPSDVLGREPLEIADLAYDARAAAPGALFFCVPGERADGHDFAADAVERGAVALVVERSLELAVPQLVVPDARAAMAVAADAFFGEPTRELEIAAVTGTNGKTTIAYLLHAVLTAAGRRPGLLGTVEARVGREARSCGRRPRRSTCSGRSARCSTRATAASRWRRPPTRPSCTGSTVFGWTRSSSRT
jgi:UDP-N-acetylmuramoyl-L-alanyl-D-glutamate--2,6-diaminopimelate ligase